MSYQIINIPIKEITPANYNPRDINPEALKGLIESIRKFGMPQPLIINKKTNVLVSGHQRLRAAQALNFDSVPVVYVELSVPEEKALNVTLNNQKISGHFTHSLGEILDEIRIELGDDFFRDIKLDEIEIPPLPEEEQAEENERADSIPEVAQNEMGVQLGDIFQLGEHRLMCGDSTDLATVEKLMNGDKADMVFTDPPYGIDEETDRAFASRTRKAKGNTFKKILGDTSIDTALKAYKICDSLSEIVCYWGGNYYAHEMSPTPCWLVWDKRVEENQKNTNSDCELAYVKHPNKESVRIFRHLWKGMIKGSEHGEGRVHPTQKPIALAEWSFKELNADGKTVLDLFCGSGSTLIACEKTGRKCYGMELDPHYCSVIIKRWETFTNKKAVKL